MPPSREPLPTLPRAHVQIGHLPIGTCRTHPYPIRASDAGLSPRKRPSIRVFACCQSGKSMQPVRQLLGGFGSVGPGTWTAPHVPALSIRRQMACDFRTGGASRSCPSRPLICTSARPQICGRASSDPPMTVASRGRDVSSLGTTSTPLGRWDAYAASSTHRRLHAPRSPRPLRFRGSRRPALRVTITGAAIGCPNSHSEFFVLYPGSHTKLVAQYYSCRAT